MRTENRGFNLVCLSKQNFNREIRGIRGREKGLTRISRIGAKGNSIPEIRAIRVENPLDHRSLGKSGVVAMLCHCTPRRGRADSCESGFESFSPAVSLCEFCGE
jgi:hypothetical protein